MQINMLLHFGMVQEKHFNFVREHIEQVFAKVRQCLTELLGKNADASLTNALIDVATLDLADQKMYHKSTI